MENRAALLVAVLWVAMAASPGRAEVVTFAFTGVINSVFDPADGLPDTIGPFDAVSGEYTFDTDAPPALMLPNNTFYNGVPLCARFETEGLELFGVKDQDDDTLSLIRYGDEIAASSGTEDQYQAELIGAAPDFNVWNLVLVTPGPSNAVLAPALTDLPATPPNLNDFVDKTFMVQPANALGAIINGDLTSLAVAAEPLLCPEPALAGVLAALAALLGLRRARDRHPAR
jgi:hypothetical protein